MLAHAEVIKKIIMCCNYNSYLELGIETGETFAEMESVVEKAFAVDIKDIRRIKKDQFFLMSTDDFFKHNHLPLKNSDAIRLSFCTIVHKR